MMEQLGKRVGKILVFITLFCSIKSNAQTDTATISITDGDIQYFVRVGYDVSRVDSANRVRKFDTAYIPAKGFVVRYKDDIIKYYTGVAVVYKASNNGLIRLPQEVKVYLPIDYPDNDKFINYLRRKLFK